MFHVEHFSDQKPGVLRKQREITSPYGEIAVPKSSVSRPRLSAWRARPRCSTWNILSLADVPRGTFSAERPLRPSATPPARESSSAHDRRIADGLARPRCSTWNIFKLCRCSTSNLFPPSAAQAARENLSPSRNSGWLPKTPMFHVEHFELGRCSTWNIFR